MGFDIATLAIFLLGIAYYAGTMVPKMDHLLRGQAALRAYLEKQLTEFDARITILEQDVRQLKEEKKGE